MDKYLDDSIKEIVKSFDKQVNCGYIELEEYLKDLVQLSELGNINSMLICASILKDSKVVKDKKTALEYFKKAADLGDFYAMEKYADILYYGEGEDIPVDKNIAADYYIKILASYEELPSKVCNYINEKLLNLSLKEFAEGGYYFNYKYAKFLYEEENRIDEAIEYYEMAVNNGCVNAFKAFADILFDRNMIEEAKKYYKIATDKGCIEAMNIYARILDEMDKNEEEVIKYYKMAADLGDAEALYSYSKKLKNSSFLLLETNDDIVENYLKMAADKGYDPAIVEYINLLCKNNKIDETIEYFEKLNVNGNIVKIFLQTNPNRVLLDILFKKYARINPNIEEDYEIYTNINETNTVIQGAKQIIINRIFKYNKEGLLSITDIAYHKDIEDKKLYEVEYKSDKKIITYFHKDADKVLLTAEIDKNGNIKFIFDESDKLENIQKDVCKILNSFENIEAFDYILAYLAYAPLQLKQIERLKNETIIFNVNCIYDVKNFLNIVNDSLDEENKDKLFICDFSIDEHNVQIIISNGNLVMLNTGVDFEYFIEKINKKFENIYPDKKEKIKISQYKTMEQEKGNCIWASKSFGCNLMMS